MHADEPVDLQARRGIRHNLHRVVTPLTSIMKAASMSNTRTAPSDPAIRRLLSFLDGERDGMHWLENHRPGLACFLRALDGGPRARQKLKSLEPAHWDEVFEA